MDMRPCAEIQHVHQRCGVADLARNLKRVLGVCERGLGIAEQPKSQRLPGQGCRADILAKTRRQRTMLGGIVEHDRAIEMRSPVYDCNWPPFRSHAARLLQVATPA